MTHTLLINDSCFPSIQLISYIFLYYTFQKLTLSQVSPERNPQIHKWDAHQLTIKYIYRPFHQGFSTPKLPSLLIVKFFLVNQTLTENISKSPLTPQYCVHQLHKITKVSPTNWNLLTPISLLPTLNPFIICLFTTCLVIPLVPLLL